MSVEFDSRHHLVAQTEGGFHKVQVQVGGRAEQHQATLEPLLESSLVATYVNAMTDILDPTMRRTLMTFGAAAARRVTLLRDGEVPEGAVYPSADLISNDAFLGGTEEATGDSTPGDAESDTPDQADNQSD